MKKVLLLAPMSSVHERFNKINIKALLDLRCEIHVGANFEIGSEETIKNNLSYKQNLESQGIVVHQIPFRRSSLIKNLSTFKMCRELFQREKFDMTHCHTETGGLITRMAMSQKTKTKYVFTPHGMSFYKGCPLKNRILYYSIEKWICNKMDAVLAMNKEEYEVLQNWKRNNEWYIHGAGIDIDAVKNTVVDKVKKRKEFGVPTDAFLILSIGELNENKNHETIIKALAKINNTKIYYLICGEGDLKSKLQNLCTSLNLSNRVIFGGYRRDIFEILNIADIFVFPSFHEGLPVSVMEAMVAGLPIVCSNIRGNVELVEHGKGGFLLKPNDINQFKSGITALINDEKLRKQMASINVENIKKFSNTTVLLELMKIYSKVIFR